MGTFIRHDLIPFEQVFWPVRVCLLLRNQKPFPKYIICHSKWGDWKQIVRIQELDVIDKHSLILGHFNVDFQGDDLDQIMVCEDHSSMPEKCKFR